LGVGDQAKTFFWMAWLLDEFSCPRYPLLLQAFIMYHLLI